METKIGEMKGYFMFYDAKAHLFRIRDSDGNEVGSGKSQADIEKQAGTLAKKNYGFPIAALFEQYNRLDRGRVTSIDIDKETVWFVLDDGYHSRGKKHLRYDRGIYGVTAHNEGVFNEVQTRRGKIAQIEDEIKALIGKLEKPIDLAYFGLKDLY